MAWGGTAALFLRRLGDAGFRRDHQAGDGSRILGTPKALAVKVNRDWLDFAEVGRTAETRTFMWSGALPLAAAQPQRIQFDNLFIRPADL